MTSVREWGAAETSAYVRGPAASDDKYSRGVVGLRTGSAQYPGAAVLGVEAAWRAGAGFVRYAGPDSAARLVLARRPETVVGADAETRVGAWVIGSGTDAQNRSDDETATLRRILAGQTPVVVDAGALDLAPGATAPVVVTPHAGELARLRAALGLAAPGTDRLTELREVARVLGATVLLKGADTLIAASEGPVLHVPAQTHWLATAGTGDVLAGVLGVLLAANPTASPPACAAAAAWLHGRAAQIAAGAGEGVPGHPIVALDVAEALPFAVGEVIAAGLLRS